MKTKKPWNELLREMRKETKLSLGEVGTMIGVPYQNISVWELGKDMPSLQRLHSMIYIYTKYIYPEDYDANETKMNLLRSYFASCKKKIDVSMCSYLQRETIAALMVSEISDSELIEIQKYLIKGKLYR